MLCLHFIWRQHRAGLSPVFFIIQLPGIVVVILCRIWFDILLYISIYMIHCYYLYSCFWFFYLQLYSSSLDGTIKLWDFMDGIPIKVCWVIPVKSMSKMGTNCLSWVVLLLTQLKTRLIMAVIECVVMIMMQILSGKKVGDVLTYWLCYLLQFWVQGSSGKCAAVWDTPIGIDPMAW